MAKIKRAKKRKGAHDEQKLSEAEAKSQRLEALAKQQQEYNIKRKAMAAEYRAAKLKAKHQREVEQQRRLDGGKSGSPRKATATY
jgi:hypothetical protein